MSTFLVFLSYNVNFMGVFSSPVSGRPNPEHRMGWWIAEPTTRGTFGLLSSCILTMILCLWTSLRLNIPRKGQNAFLRMGHKLAWTLLALILPELVVYIAWRQWVSANALRNKVNEDFEKQGKDYQWTIVHGFYAVMGGFVVEINDPENRILRNKPEPRLITLTSHGVCLLSKHGYLPEISESFILDKSKADYWVKAFACTQATWCLLQCLGRLARHLPVTLLEVNALGHAFYALTIYLSWWYKPLDIREPYVLSGQWVPGLGAYMVMQSQISARTLSSTQKHCEMHYLGRREEPVGTITTSDEEVTLGQGQTLLGTRFYFKELSEEPHGWTKSRVKLPAVLRPEDVRRWRLASAAMDQHDIDSLDTKPRDLVTRAISNIPTNNLLIGNISSRALAIRLALVSATYCGLHVAAWNSYFPSGLEATMWRSYSIVVLVFAMAASPIIAFSSKGFPRAAIIAYTFLGICRIPLVIEAFASIRRLPVNAYKTPGWTQFLPHL